MKSRTKKGEKCSICCKKTGHSDFLCVQPTIARKANNKKGNNNKKQSNEEKGTFLETFSCPIRNAVGLFLVRGLLDTGSLHSYIHDDLVSRLRLGLGKRRKLDICHFGSEETYSFSSAEVLVTLQNDSNSERTFRFRSIDCITGRIIIAPLAEVVREVLPDYLR